MSHLNPSTAPGPTFVLRCIQGKLANRNFTFQGTAMIGRLPGLDLFIDDPSVSRRHAKVEFSGGRVFVLDLGSANGTRINHRLIHGRARLRSGARLQFGAADSIFELSEPARGPLFRPIALAAAVLLAIPLAWAMTGMSSRLTPAPSERAVAAQEFASLPADEVASEIPAATGAHTVRAEPADRPPSERVEARTVLIQELEQQSGSLDLAQVLASYWEGRLKDARARLKKLAEQAESDAQERLKAVGEEFSFAERLFKRGEGLLAARAPELAKEPFVKALEHDRRLLEGVGDRYPSYYRRKIQEDMARNCYAKGRQWLERRNQRKACRVWKLGFEFYKGNPDLNKAVASCSRRGAEALRKVRSCEQLLEALDFAIDGDGLAPRIDEMRTAFRCRS